MHITSYVYQVIDVEIYTVHQQTLIFPIEIDLDQ